MKEHFIFSDTVAASVAMHLINCQVSFMATHNKTIINSAPYWKFLVTELSEEHAGVLRTILGKDV